MFNAINHLRQVHVFVVVYSSLSSAILALCLYAVCMYLGFRISFSSLVVMFISLMICIQVSLLLFCMLYVCIWAFEFLFQALLSCLFL